MLSGFVIGRSDFFNLIKKHKDCVKKPKHITDEDLQILSLTLAGFSVKEIAGRQGLAYSYVSKAVLHLKRSIDEPLINQINIFYFNLLLKHNINVLAGNATLLPTGNVTS